ncbi:hypothetical protein [Vibrio crassostreae]|uniref:hypothetical protein n=1 Tax=Vibrio crassostreae TaxID=246167 RepID=UPI001B317467|nr:hypothetical protein [Vibrio crassostreae]
MEHCGIEYFVNDKFCVKCGAELAVNQSVLTVAQAYPELADGVNLKSVTGIVVGVKPFKTVESHSYKETSSNKTVDTNVTNERSYMWCELRDSKGNLHEILANSSPKLANLGVDEFVTVVNYDQNSISPDASAPAFVVGRMLSNVIIRHNVDDGHYVDTYLIRKPDDTRLDKPSVFMRSIVAIFPLAALIFMGGLEFYKIIPIDILGLALFWAASVTLFSKFSFGRYNKSVAEYESVMDGYRAYMSKLSDLAHITPEGLNLTAILRRVKDSDVQCGGCGCFKGGDDLFCYSCGVQAKPKVELSAPLSSDVEGGKIVIESEQQLEGLVAQLGTSEVSSSKSAAQVKYELMRDASFNLSTDFEVSQFLWFSVKYHLDACLVLGEVVDIAVSERVSHASSSSSYDTVTKKETTTYRNGEIYNVDVKEVARHSNVTVNQSRTVTQVVTMSVRLFDGSLVSIVVPSECMDSIKRGSWVSMDVIKLSWKGGSGSSIGCVYNISSGKYVTNVLNNKYNVGTSSTGYWLVGFPIVAMLLIAAGLALTEDFTFSLVFAALGYGVYKLTTWRYGTRKDKNISAARSAYSPLDDAQEELVHRSEVVSILKSITG